MNLGFAKTFEDDLEAVTDVRLLARLERLLDSIRAARRLADIPSLKPLAGGHGCFRVRLGDYRLGLRREADKVVCVRFLHRREVYRHFP